MSPIALRNHGILVAWSGRRRFLFIIVALALCSAPSAPATDSEPRVPPDHLFAGRAESPGSVTFRHTTHADPAPGVCLRCHPRPFSILGRSGTVTHAIMEGGGACGLCHDGRNAFAAADSDACELCHDMSGGSDGDGP